MNIKQRFGVRIKELRKQKGLSQEKLANLADIDRTYLPTISIETFLSPFSIVGR